MGYVVALPILAVGASLQASFFSRITLGAAAPQLVLLGVIAWGLARGPVEGGFAGFWGGLFYDLAIGGPVGVSAFAMLVVAGLAGAVGKQLFGSNPLMPVIAVFAATVLHCVLVGFLLATLHYPTDWQAVTAGVAVPTALANAILSLAVYPVVSFAAGHLSRRTRVGY